MMLSKTRILMIAGAALAVGCNLDDGSKNSCNVQTDCLTGYQCVNNTCIGGGTDSGGIVLIDAPGSGSKFYGTVEPLTSLSAGMAAGNYETLAGVTTAAGNLGCAVVGDLDASPGAGAAVVYAKVKPESGDYRCPEGVFAIMNDPSSCTSTFPSDLRPNCALYKRWDASGKQVANQLAIGGYVSVQEMYISSMASRCSAEMSINFAGGVTVTKSFTYDYNPLAPGSAFCQH
ncbi:MAG TPA: hypothetical protein VIV11_06570 [Kofleriaceae bacterium]